MILFISYLLRICMFLPCNFIKKDGKHALRFNKVLSFLSVLLLICLAGIAIWEVIDLSQSQRTKSFFQFTFIVVASFMYFQYISITLYQLIYMRQFINICGSMYILHDRKIKSYQLKPIQLYIIIFIAIICSVLIILNHCTLNEIGYYQILYFILNTHRTMSGIIFSCFYVCGIQLLAANLENTVTEHCVPSENEVGNYFAQNKIKQSISDNLVHKIAKPNLNDLFRSIITNRNTFSVTNTGANQIFNDIVLIENTFTLIMKYFKFPILLMLIYDGFELVLSLIFIAADHTQYNMWIFALPCLCRITCLLKTPTSFIAIVSILMDLYDSHMKLNLHHLVINSFN